MLIAATRRFQAGQTRFDYEIILVLRVRSKLADLVKLKSRIQFL
jgi:hypothetical protein